MAEDNASARQISLVITGDQLDGPPGVAILRGIHDESLERGWSLCRCQHGPISSAVTDWRPDAVILVLDRGSIATAKALHGQVVVSAGQDLTHLGWRSAVPDDAEAGRKAAHHFLERGLRSLAVFGYWETRHGKKVDDWATRRAAGFVEFARHNETSVIRYGDRIDPATGLPEGGDFGAICKWVTDLPRPTGLFAPCDAWAQSMSIYAHRLGLRVPEDLSIVGVDDDSTICQTNDPPLSSVAIPWELIGRTAAKLAADAIAGGRRGPGPVVVQAADVAVRRSSDIVAVSDTDVAAALAMILAHANRPLKVTEILRRVATTQRHLERQFKKLVGRRIVDEIRRVHVEHAKRFLSGSDMPMPLVAHKCGFHSSSQLSTAFRRETGISPTTFRRKFRLES